MSIALLRWNVDSSLLLTIIITPVLRRGFRSSPGWTPQKHGLWSQLGQVGGCSLSGSMLPPLAPRQAPSSCSGHALSGFCCFLISREGEHPLVWWLACTVSSFASQLLVSFTHFPIGLLAVFLPTCRKFLYPKPGSSLLTYMAALSSQGMACLFTMFMLSLVTWKILILTQVTSPPHLPPKPSLWCKVWLFESYFRNSAFTDVIQTVSCVFLSQPLVLCLHQACMWASCGWWFEALIYLGPLRAPQPRTIYHGVHLSPPLPGTTPASRPPGCPIPHCLGWVLLYYYHNHFHTVTKSWYLVKEHPLGSSKPSGLCFCMTFIWCHLKNSVGIFIALNL